MTKQNRVKHPLHLTNGSQRIQALFQKLPLVSSCHLHFLKIKKDPANYR